MCLMVDEIDSAKDPFLIVYWTLMGILQKDLYKLIQNLTLYDFGEKCIVLKVWKQLCIMYPKFEIYQCMKNYGS